MTMETCFFSAMAGRVVEDDRAGRVVEDYKTGRGVTEVVVAGCVGRVTRDNRVTVDSVALVADFTRSTRRSAST
jgi:hypothetical protein